MSAGLKSRVDPHAYATGLWSEFFNASSKFQYSVDALASSNHAHGEPGQLFTDLLVSSTRIFALTYEISAAKIQSSEAQKKLHGGAASTTNREAEIRVALSSRLEGAGWLDQLQYPAAPCMSTKMFDRVELVAALTLHLPEMSEEVGRLNRLLTGDSFSTESEVCAQWEGGSEHYGMNHFLFALPYLAWLANAEHWSDGPE